MADTQTTYFQLVQPDVGASNNTWGDKSNQNWADVDTALFKTRAIRNNGDPNGVVTSDYQGQFALDTSLSPPQLYIATASGVNNAWIVAAANVTAKQIDLTGAVTERHQTLGAVSGTVTINLANGGSAALTVDGNTTLALSNVPASGRATYVTLELTNPGAYSLAFPSSTQWASAAAPVWPSSGKSLVSLRTTDGGATWQASLIGHEFA